MNDIATIHQHYKRLRAFVCPSIFALLGLSLLLLLFRKNVNDVVGTWWCDTVLSGIVVCIFITGINGFFKGFKDENQRLYQDSTNNNESIQQQKTRLKQLSHDEVQERFRSKVKTNSRPSDPINIPISQQPSDENCQLRNLLLKKTDILGEQNIALKHLRTETANQTKEIQKLQSELSIKNEYIQQKDSETECMKEELKMLKQQVERLQKESLIKDEELKQKKSLEDFEKVSKEAQKLRKQVSTKDVMNYNKDEKVKEWEKAYLKLEQKLRQNNTLLLPKKRQISIQPRTLQQTPVHSVVLCKNVRQQNDFNDKENLNLSRKQSSPSKAVCENCQQEVQQNDEDKKLGLPRKTDDAVSNVTRKYSSSPERLPEPCDVVVQPDDDPTFPPSLFSSSTPCFISAVSESALNSVKETPPFKTSPKPVNTVSPTNLQRSPSTLNFVTPKKSVTRSFIYPITPTYPRSIIYHNKSYIETSSSTNNTPKRNPQGRRRVFFL